MGRLTQRTQRGSGQAYFNYNEISFPDRYSRCFGSVADKLADYEDAEEQGLLLRLPCKVGKPVWTIMCGMNGKNPTLFRQDFELSMIQHWGKAVFLTKEEAKKALAERGKG